MEAGGRGDGDRGDGDLQSLDARDDGVEGGLDVGGGAGANHREAVVLEQVRQVLKGGGGCRVQSGPLRGPREGQRRLLTWPCQSDVLISTMLSGRRFSETRMWFSWSYTVFLGICRSERTNFLVRIACF